MIDLHIHSNFSDGSDTIEQIVDKIIKNDISHFSITDHDTISGVKYLLANKKIQEKLTINNIEFISGIEFSCILNEKEKMHILGYNINPNSKELNFQINNGKQKRKDKLKRRLEQIENNGFSFTNSQKEWIFSLETSGKPQIAKLLVENEYFSNIEDAIQKAINVLPKSNIIERLNTTDVINAIHSAGGYAVWAHSIGGISDKKLSYEKLEEILKILVTSGLDGLECYYGNYNCEEIEKLVELANKYHLLITCGSDYHGTIKLIKLGETSKEYCIIPKLENITLLNKLKRS